MSFEPITTLLFQCGVLQYLLTFFTRDLNTLCQEARNVSVLIFFKTRGNSGSAEVIKLPSYYSNIQTSREGQNYHTRLRPDFTSNLIHGLAFGKRNFYIEPYGKINHGLVNLSSYCDVK